MKICIAGGGALGHVIAGYIAAKEQHKVVMLTRKPDKWSDLLTIYGPHNEIMKGRLASITDNAQEACRDVDIVLLCLPGFAIAEELQRISKYLSARTYVGSVVCSSGFFFDAFRYLPEMQPLFGFQRVPFIARIKEYGQSAYILGKKNALHLAVEHSDKPEAIKQAIEEMLYGPIHLLGSHYEASLTNSNPLLHTARLYSLWKDYEEGMVYQQQPLFYHDWTVETSELLIAMDEEFQLLCDKIGIRKGSIPPLLEYYESDNAETLTRKIKSIPAFAGLKAPMREVCCVDGGGEVHA